MNNFSEKSPIELKSVEHMEASPLLSGLNYKRTELQSRELAKILELAAILTNTSPDDFVKNIKQMPEKIRALPTPDVEISNDKMLMTTLEKYIEGIENIKEQFVILNILNDETINQLGNLPSSSQKLFLESNYKDYKKLSNKIKDISIAFKEAEAKLSLRLEKDAKKKDPSIIAIEVISNSQNVNLHDANQYFVQFHERTRHLEGYPAFIREAEKKRSEAIVEFKQSFCYLAYLCANQCTHSKFNFGCFISGYSLGKFNYIDFFDFSNTDFDTSNIMDLTYDEEKSDEKEFI
ncbi:MAG: hypothetical protein H0V82_03165 [Candidatus Protochlamydia sp.]|nr:hypothetical protein [Candidatus Protochlamydia sp.]